MEEKYYIRSTKRGYIGNSFLWWGKESRGYTTDLKSAGRYSFEEAQKICSAPGVDDVAYSCDYIDSLGEGLKLIADSQYIDSSKALFK